MSMLMWLFITPFITSALAFLPVSSGSLFKRFAVLLSLVPLAILLLNHAHWIGSTVQYPWLPQLSIDFHLNVDGISLIFLYLTAIIIPISLLSVRSENLAHPHMFYGLVLLLQGLLIGFFTTRDLALFTIFWESMLIPLYFIINIWGGETSSKGIAKISHLYDCRLCINGRCCISSLLCQFNQWSRNF